MGLYVKRNDGYSESAYNLNTGDNSAQIKVGGSVKVSKNLKIDTRNGATVTLGFWSGDVAHNSDGTLTLSISGSFTMDSPLTGGSVSADFKCTDIPRASSFEVSPKEINPGGALSVTVSSAASSFSHKITVSLGSEKIEKSIASGASGASFTIPKSWANTLKNQRSGKGALSVQTYSGSKLIGTKSGAFTLLIPDSEEYRPSFSFETALEGSDTVKSWGVFVKNKSSVSVSLKNESYKYGASFSSVSINAFGVTKTEAPAVIPATSSGSVKVTVTLKDSRGLKTTAEKTLQIEDYSPPSLDFSKLYRCALSGEKENLGTYLAAEFTKKFSSVGGRNSETVTLRYKKSGESAYVSLNAENSPVIFGGAAISVSDSYDVELSVKDMLTAEENVFIRRISSADIPFNIRHGGKGAAFGCYAEKDGELTVAYDLNVLGSIKCDDVFSRLENKACVSSVIGNARVFSSLGITFFNLRFTLSSDVPKNTDTVLATLPEEAPLCFSPLSVHIGGNSSHCVGYMTYQSEIGFKCETDVKAGTWVYINGAVINNLSSDAE